MMLTLKKLDESFKVDDLSLQLVNKFFFHFSWVYNLKGKEEITIEQLHYICGNI